MGRSVEEGGDLVILRKQQQPPSVISSPPTPTASSSFTRLNGDPKARDAYLTPNPKIRLRLPCEVCRVMMATVDSGTFL